MSECDLNFVIHWKKRNPFLYVFGGAFCSGENNTILVSHHTEKW
jgi:hypothetical protein